jgi:hypothetical protein
LGYTQRASHGKEPGVPVYQFTLTGEGDQPFAALGKNIIGVETDVLVLGAARRIGAEALDRFVDLGWFSMFETMLSNPDGIPDGNHYNTVHFITFEQEGNYRVGQDITTGMDGFHYALRTGVQVLFSFLSTN